MYEELCDKKTPSLVKANIVKNLKKEDVISLCMSNKKCIKNFCKNKTLWNYMIRNKYGFVPDKKQLVNFYYNGYDVTVFHKGFKIKFLGLTDVLDVFIFRDRFYVLDIRNNLLKYEFEFNIFDYDSNSEIDFSKHEYQITLSNIIEIKGGGNILLALNKEGILYEIDSEDVKKVKINVIEFYFISFDVDQYIFKDDNSFLYSNYEINVDTIVAMPIGNSFRLKIIINEIDYSQDVEKIDFNHKYGYVLLKKGYLFKFMTYEDPGNFFKIASNVTMVTKMAENLFYVSNDVLYVFNDDKIKLYDIKKPILDLISLNIAEIRIEHNDYLASYNVLAIIDINKNAYIYENTEKDPILVLNNVEKVHLGEDFIISLN